jgi:hypothetical protein
MSIRLFFFLLLAWQGMAQTPFIREGSIGQPASKSNSEREGFGTLEIKDWTGQKFIFLPTSKKLQGYGYQAFSPSLPYDKWVGKTLIVVEVSRKDVLPEITFRTADGKTLRTKAYGDSIHGIAPLRDLEYARSNWLGKTLWLRDNSLATWDESSQEFGSVKLKKYSPVVVEDVVAGWYEHEPIRLILKTAKGEVGFRDVNVTGTNISERLRKYRRFADEFLEQDPRVGRNWPPEIWSAIEDAKVAIGMTSEQARMSWGEPTSVNRTTTSRGAEEQWVYGNSTYLYIQDGKVTAVQN